VLYIYSVALALAVVTFSATGCAGSAKTVATTSAAAKATGPAKATTMLTQVDVVKFASGEPLKHSDWITKGDAICEQTNKAIDANPIKTQADFARLLPQVALYDKTEAAELGKLVPPASKVKDWRQIVNGYQLFGEYTATVAEYALAGNFAAAKPLVFTAGKIHKRIVAIAKRDGFKVCSFL
jgi:hypothetical protein